jgi:superfamily II DNA or RNA helicase
VPISPHQACYDAHELTRLGAVGDLDRLSTTLFDAKVDLNPHQVEAALFAMANPLQKGVILADEVGLGKTIEAGLVLCQKWAERRRRLIVVAPAHLRKQWQGELHEKFELPSRVIDRGIWNRLLAEGVANPFDCGQIPIISYGLAARMKDELRAVPFDLVVFDEAHKLRNAYQPSRKGGQAVRWAFELRTKLLLTATPLQNSLLELYGLGWVIDDRIFGDRGAFQTRYCSGGGDLSDLKARLAPLCTRTLRKDCPSINYTKRQAITHRFRQTDDEKRLHADVLEFMLRKISFAFPHRQRKLVEMILLKSLASSSLALATTLGTIRRRLVAIRDGESPISGDALAALLAADEELDIESTVDDFGADEPPAGEPTRSAAEARLVADELSQIDSLLARAGRGAGDSKAAALLQALKQAFARLEELGAARKALIFTESRRTQDYLADLLEVNGYAGRVVIFNGSNAHPAAKAAYERYVREHEGSDRLTGSRAIDTRAALIEEFRGPAEVLLATEAAAEGVNLQFCSMVVNYDLPWNPQRVEQRIGRCHRYGQKHDVVVVNFLAADNVADRRIHELLQHKFSLFDGLFGASDQVLGAIEDEVDFEARVFEILRRCRTEREIEEAFDQLQRDLEDVISERMARAREQLFEHFDADVHERLRLGRDDAQQALDRVRTRFWRLIRWALPDRARLDDTRLSVTVPTAPAAEIPAGEHRLISAVKDLKDGPEEEVHLLRLSSPLGLWVLERGKAADVRPTTVRFDVSRHPRKISSLTTLIGRTGWLRLDKLTVESDAREEFLLFTAVTDEGENIEQEVVHRLMDVDGLGDGGADRPATVPDAAISDRLAADADRLVTSTLTRAAERTSDRFRQLRAQIERWAEDKLAAAELELDRLKRAIRDARRETELAETAQQGLDAERRLADFERSRRRQRQAIADLEDELEAKRRELIGRLQEQMAQHANCETLFVIRWEVQ